MIKDVEICKSTLSLGLIDLCSVRHHAVLMIYTGCLFIVTSHQDVIREAALYLRNIITSICHMSAPCVSSHQVMSVQYVPCLCLQCSFITPRTGDIISCYRTNPKDIIQTLPLFCLAVPQQRGARCKGCRRTKRDWDYVKLSLVCNPIYPADWSWVETFKSYVPLYDISFNPGLHQSFFFFKIWPVTLHFLKNMMISFPWQFFWQLITTAGARTHILIRSPREFKSLNVIEPGPERDTAVSVAPYKRVEGHFSGTSQFAL